MSGLYTITVGKKIYVGQTRQPFKKRWAEHLADLKAGDHANYLLQNLWDGFGDGKAEGHFKFAIAREMPGASTKELLAAEAEMIRKVFPGGHCVNVDLPKGLSHAAGKGNAKKKDVTTTRKKRSFPWWVRFGALVSGGIVGFAVYGWLGAIACVGAVVILEVT